MISRKINLIKYRSLENNLFILDTNKMNKCLCEFVKDVTEFKQSKRKLKHKYSIEIIEPCTNKIRECMLAYIDLTSFEVKIAYRFLFGELNDNLLDEDMDMYENDSVENELVNFISGFYAIRQAMRYPLDRLSYYAKMVNGKINYNFCTLKEFEPYVSKRKDGYYIDINVDEWIKLPEKVSKIIKTKYPCLEPIYMEFIKTILTDKLTN